MDQELLKEFLWSTRDDIESFEQALMRLEQQESEDSAKDINHAYRICHSLKGSAGLLQLSELEKAAHTGENLLGSLRSDPTLLQGDHIASLLIFADGVKQTLDLAEREQREPDDAFDAFLDLLRDHIDTDEVAIVPDLDPKPKPPAPTSATAAAPLPPEAPPPPVTPQPASPPEPSAPPEADKKEKKAQFTPPSAPVETAIRVNVHLLNKMMNLLGELVLTRNRLLQIASEDDGSRLQATAQSLDQITSELQENIMRTRMQPVSSVFGKFPRIVRDLSRQLGKEVHLEMTGQETELDRSILESMRDPFTHLLRNCLDHGIEEPHQRAAAGKSSIGRIVLSARHEGGQVIVEVRDDGKGINLDRVKAKAIAAGLLSEEHAAAMSDAEAGMLICHPGLSTAEQVTNISGRGVGMDVVRSNIEAIGGSLDISSQVGAGTTMRIAIPLTLAIIPALMIACDGKLYGIPQINLVELVGLQPEEAINRIESVRGAEVFRLRDHLLTLVRLRSILGLPPAEPDPDQMLFVVVVAAGDQQFGLVVDDIHDTEEIVVKALSRQLSGIEHYAGATIRGDGSVCLILEMAGIVRAAKLSSGDSSDIRQGNTETEPVSEQQDFLVFHVGQTRFAAPLQLVNRIEQHSRDHIKRLDGTTVLKRDRQLMPAIDLTDHIGIEAGSNYDNYQVIITQVRGGIGILADEVVDSMRLDLTQTIDDPGVLRNPAYSAICLVDDHPTILLDVYNLIKQAFPDTSEPSSGNQIVPNPAPISPRDGGPEGRILYCEDAPFFQKVVANYLREAGHQVDVVANGQVGWERLQQHADRYNLILTDLEMPVMDGWELMRAVRSLPDLNHLPLLALTSQSDEQARQQSMRAGADDHVVKLQRDELLVAINDLITQRLPTGSGAS